MGIEIASDTELDLDYLDAGVGFWQISTKPDMK